MIRALLFGLLALLLVAPRAPAQTTVVHDISGVLGSCSSSCPGTSGPIGPALYADGHKVIRVVCNGDSAALWSLDQCIDTSLASCVAGSEFISVLSSSCNNPVTGVNDPTGFYRVSVTCPTCTSYRFFYRIGDQVWR